MFTKPRPSISYHLLHILSQRKELSHEEATMKGYLKRGLKGEKRFYNIIKKGLDVPCIPIYSLQLDVNMNEFQIDCLLIFNEVIYLIEVKNYYGDYKVSGDHWVNIRTKTSIKNPLHQLSRSTMLLRSWLDMHEFSLPIIPKIAFMNPNFFLYEAREDMPIIFPSQHGTFLKGLHVYTQSLPNQAEQLVAKLQSTHINHSRHEYIPTYTDAELKKNIFCQKCLAAFSEKRHTYFYCDKCVNKECVHTALFRTIKEFELLFPKTPLQIHTIQKWIGGHTFKKYHSTLFIKTFQVPREWSRDILFLVVLIITNT